MVSFNLVLNCALTSAMDIDGLEVEEKGSNSGKGLVALDTTYIQYKAII